MGDPSTGSSKSRKPACMMLGHLFSWPHQYVTDLERNGNIRRLYEHSNNTYQADGRWRKVQLINPLIILARHILTGDWHKAAYFETCTNQYICNIQAMIMTVSLLKSIVGFSVLLTYRNCAEV